MIENGAHVQIIVNLLKCLVFMLSSFMSFFSLINTTDVTYSLNSFLFFKLNTFPFSSNQDMYGDNSHYMQWRLDEFTYYHAQMEQYAII